MGRNIAERKKVVRVEEKKKLEVRELVVEGGEKGGRRTKEAKGEETQ